MIEKGIVRPAPRTAGPKGAPDAAWRAVGWFGLLLAVVGLADIALVWYPVRTGNPTWEFGAIDLSFSSLPLLTMGTAALLGSALSRGSRWLTTTVALALVALGLTTLAAYAVFLTNVPLALRVAPAEVVVGIKKAVVKTSVLGVAFSTAYLVAGIAALRHTYSHRR